MRHCRLTSRCTTSIDETRCPTGKSRSPAEFLSSPRAKNTSLAPSGKSPARFRASRLDAEGRYGQSSRNVGRDAVDATMSCAHEIAGRGQTRERSREARETSGVVADGEVVWSWHPLLMLNLAEVHSAQPGSMRHPIRGATVAKGIRRRGDHV